MPRQPSCYAVCATIRYDVRGKDTFLGPLLTGLQAFETLSAASKGYVSAPQSSPGFVKFPLFRVALPLLRGEGLARGRRSGPSQLTGPFRALTKKAVLGMYTRTKGSDRALAAESASENYLEDRASNSECAPGLLRCIYIVHIIKLHLEPSTCRISVH